MEFPDDVLSVIRDFSRPCTRPDWRELHRMPSFHFHWNVARSFNLSCSLVLLELVIQDGPEYRYRMNFHDGIPYIAYIYGGDMVGYFVQN
jgi:hypothetical protein